MFRGYVSGIFFVFNGLASVRHAHTPRLEWKELVLALRWRVQERLEPIYCPPVEIIPTSWGHWSTPLLWAKSQNIDLLPCSWLLSLS